MFNPVSTTLENAKCKLINLINTRPGQRVLAHNCQFGLDILGLLFENTITTQQFQINLTRGITRWIPEITIISIDIEQSQHTIQIRILFKVGEQTSDLLLEYNLNEQ